MEIGLKEKIIVTAVMGILFSASFLLKEMVQSDSKEGYVLSNTRVSSERENDWSQEEGSSALQEKTEAGSAREKTELILDVQGAVLTPGIVRLPEGSRVYEALEKAGGVLENADTKYINQAEPVEDGMIIYVPWREGEAEGVLYRENGVPIQEQTGLQANQQHKKININQADETLLMELPGIGEVLAADIVAYRTEHGFFQKTESIKEVPGIGEKKFEQIQDLISVY